MNCAMIDSMLATQRQMQADLTDQIKRDQVADALATVRLNEANEKKAETMATLNTHQQQLKAATQMIEMLSQTRAAMMC